MLKCGLFIFEPHDWIIKKGIAYMFHGIVCSTMRRKDNTLGDNITIGRITVHLNSQIGDVTFILNFSFSKN